MGEVRENWFRISPVRRLQRLAHQMVEAPTLSGAQFVVKDDPDQRVRELECPRTGLLDDMRGDRFVQRLQHGFFVPRLASQRQDVQGELPTDHRRDRQNFVAGDRQQIQAAADHFPHAFGGNYPAPISTWLTA